MKDKKRKRGSASIIGLLIFAIIIVLILNFLNINIKTVMSNSSEQNSAYFNNISQNLWSDYLGKPITSLWNNFLSGIFSGITGNGVNFQNLAPTVPIGGTNVNPNANNSSAN